MNSASTTREEQITLSAAVYRYFDVSLYLLVLMGFGTIASTGALDFPTVLLVGVALVVRGYLLATRRTLIIPQDWTNYLTIIYVAFYLLDYFLLSGSFITALVHLVLFLMVVRLFSTQRERDHYMLALLSFVMVLAAAVLTVDSIFLLAFAGFMLMAVVTFILMEMRHSGAVATVHGKESAESREYRRMAFSLLAAAPLLALLILAGGTVIFFLLPRVSAHFLTSYALTNDLSTGFSDRVQLGRIGQIQQSSTVVMHVRIDDDTRGAYDLKWRGVALNLFHGKSWSSSLEQRPALHLPDGEILPVPAGLRRADAGDEPAIPAPYKNIHYRVMMEPIGANVFFVAPKLASLRGNYGRVNVDSAGAVYDVDSDRPIGAYEANSNIAQPSPGELRQASENYPASVLLADLQLPNIDPRIPRLAQQVTASADNNYDRALALEHYLISTYGYTLELPRTSPPDPLADFLFERKRGHCEYFASAMAVMLRTLHIPSRVVNGFRTGEFNDLTSSYVVRASNAHSWVEAYFPGHGWVSFDPTPAAPVQFRGGWSRMMLYMDAMASFWREWVIDYDSTHQAILGHQAVRGSRALVDSMRSGAQSYYAFLLGRVRNLQNRITRSPRRWIFIGLTLTIIFLLLANARQIWNFLRDRRLRAHPERAPRIAATLWYERLTRALARTGWRKTSQQTPTEFIHTIDDANLRQLVQQFTSHYESARFGGSARDAALLPGLYGMISGEKSQRKNVAATD